MAEHALRVIKLGGSLLELDGLAGTLRRWLAMQSPADNVIVVGGGPMVDFLRQADQRHGLGEEASHWLAIRAMDLTAHLLGAMLPEAPLIDWLPCHAPREPGRTRIVLPTRMLREFDRQQDFAPLPHCWEVTSDSIAAWLGGILVANEIVLLKSRLPGSGGDSDALVDPYFTNVSRRIPLVRCVNLREAAFPERRL